MPALIRIYTRGLYQRLAHAGIACLTLCVKKALSSAPSPASARPLSDQRTVGEDITLRGINKYWAIFRRSRISLEIPDGSDCLLGPSLGARHLVTISRPETASRSHPVMPELTPCTRARNVGLALYSSTMRGSHIQLAQEYRFGSGVLPRQERPARNIRKQLPSYWKCPVEPIWLIAFLAAARTEAAMLWPALHETANPAWTNPLARWTPRAQTCAVAGAVNA